MPVREGRERRRGGDLSHWVGWGLGRFEGEKREEEKGWAEPTSLTEKRERARVGCAHMLGRVRLVG